MSGKGGRMKDKKEKTYGDIFEEFIQKVGCKNEISDYRQCIPFYGYPVIPNAIIVWLKDGSTLIYQTDTLEVE
jgi:hypothetical protein